MKRIIYLIMIVSMIFIGCGNNTVCPKYPIPKQSTITLLLKKDPIWLEKQYKLKLKLNQCRKDKK